MFIRINIVGFVTNVEKKKDSTSNYVIITVACNRNNKTTWIKLFVRDYKIMEKVEGYIKGNLIYAEGSMAIGDPSYGLSILTNVSYITRLSKAEAEATQNFNSEDILPLSENEVTYVPPPKTTDTEITQGAASDDSRPVPEKEKGSESKGFEDEINKNLFNLTKRIGKRPKLNKSSKK